MARQTRSGVAGISTAAMAEGAEGVPMARIDYEPGSGDRFMLLVVTKRYGGDPRSPLYEPQARRLMDYEREAGFLTRLIRLLPDRRQVIESDF